MIPSEKSSFSLTNHTTECCTAVVKQASQTVVLLPGLLLFLLILCHRIAAHSQEGIWIFQVKTLFFLSDSWFQYFCATSAAQFPVSSGFDLSASLRCFPETWWFLCHLSVCVFFNHSSSVWYQKSKSRWLLSVCFSLSLENNLMESFLKQIMERVCCGLYCLCSPASICFQRMLKHLLSRFKISIFQLRTTKSWRFLPYYFQNIDTPSEIPFLLLFWDPGSACRVGGTSPRFCVSVSESTRWSGVSDPNTAAKYVYLNPAFPSLGPITTEFYSEVKEECWVMEASKLSRSAIQLAASHGNILIYVLKINFLR